MSQSELISYIPFQGWDLVMPGKRKLIDDNLDQSVGAEALRSTVSVSEIAQTTHILK